MGFHCDPRLQWPFPRRAGTEHTEHEIRVSTAVRVDTLGDSEVLIQDYVKNIMRRYKSNRKRVILQQQSVYTSNKADVVVRKR